jgi:hypothetical protein
MSTESRPSTAPVVAELCANCGRSNPPGTISCEHCSRSSAWTEPKKPNWVLSVGIGLLVYLAGCNVGLILRHAHPPSPPPAIVQPAP